MLGRCWRDNLAVRCKANAFDELWLQDHFQLVVNIALQSFTTQHLLLQHTPIVFYTL